MRNSNGNRKREAGKLKNKEETGKNEERKKKKKKETEKRFEEKESKYSNKIWYGSALRHINSCGLYNSKSCYIYIYIYIYKRIDCR